MNLKHGEKVNLVAHDGTISIYPEIRDPQLREITLNLNKRSSSQSLKRGIIAAYLDGFDTIELKTETAFTENQQKSVRDTINRLFGLEVVEITSNTVIVECLLKQRMPVNKTISRIHRVIMLIFTEIVSALELQNLDLLKGLLQRTQDCKRLSLVTNRLLRSIILFPQPSQIEEITLIDCVDYLQILHITSEITANLKKIAENIEPLIDPNIPKRLTKILVENSKNIKKLYDDSIQSLLSKDIPLANNVLDTSYDTTNLWNLCLKSNESSEISSLSLSNFRLIIDSLDQIQQQTHEIANISIDRAEATNTKESTTKSFSKPRNTKFGKT
jgi:phosphate uptake regulator